MNRAVILYKLSKLLLFGGINMKNWKTTVAGLVAAAGQILGFFGVPPEVGNAVSVLGLFILGLVSKDFNVTGGTVKE